MLSHLQTRPRQRAADLHINFTSEGYQPLHSAQTHISFDELVEISCNIPFAEQAAAAAAALKPSPGIVQQQHISFSGTNAADSNGEFAPDVSPAVCRREQMPPLVSCKEVKKLDVQVEEVTRRQDEIARKLCMLYYEKLDSGKRAEVRK